MTNDIRPLTSDFTPEISGTDLTHPLSRADVVAIEGGMTAVAGDSMTAEQLAA